MDATKRRVKDILNDDSKSGLTLGDIEDMDAVEDARKLVVELQGSDVSQLLSLSTTVLYD